MEWIEKIFTWFGNQSGLANLIQIATPAVAVGVILHRIWRKRVNRQNQINEHLEATIALQKEEIGGLEKEIEELKQYAPHLWLKAAAKERKDGNEEKAITVFRQGLQQTQAALKQTHLELARHHVSVYPDHDMELHLNEADRLARIASLLDPSDGTAHALSEEIHESIKLNELKAGSYKPDAADLDSIDYEPVIKNQAEAEALILELIRHILVQRDAGHYFIVERLAHRAHVVGTRSLAKENQVLCTARRYWADALQLCGIYQGAFTELDSLLPIEERVRGAEHPGTLSTRYLRANVLQNLGRYDDALTELDSLLPIEERVRGAEHPYTLITRSLHADVLRRSYNLKGALSELETLLPVQEKVSGIEHPRVLVTRYRYSKVLSDLGRNSEAVEALDALLPIQQRVSGEKHPDTLATQKLRTNLLKRP